MTKKEQEDIAYIDGFNAGYDKGYKQAEENNALTWKDVMGFRLLFDIYDAELDAGVAPYAPMCKEYYEEILKRFNDRKNNK